MNRILDFYRLQESDGLYLFWLKEILVALAIFTLFYGLSCLSRFLLIKVAPRLTSATKTDLDDRILERISPPVTLLIVCAGAYYAVHYLQLPTKVQTISSGTIFVINVIIFTNIAYRVIDEIMNWYAATLAEKGREGLDRQLIPLAEKVIVIFLVGTALIVTLKHFDYDILSLVTALGIGSLAIGMAAKDTLAHVISGFTLMIDRPFRIGDRIQLAGGQMGDVADIGLRSTKIRTLDNTLLIIPNSDLCNTILINQAFPDVRAKGRISVGVSYGSDMEQVKQLLSGIALDIPEVLRDPAPEPFFVSFGDSALNMALFFWVDDYSSLFAVSDKINSRILQRFREQGIVIPFPTRTVHMEKEQ
ncbi:MAG: mechanosensitive ion channel protein MscS [Geobacter sp.]|nr:MAG: mechanosensitive ion channel protein MscS [Geobacter sp.]